MSMLAEGNNSTCNAESVRAYLCRHYFEPARERRETLVTLRAGDIHRELGLRNRVPNVCQVMESRVLERQAGVRISSKQGPPSGRGTSLTVTYSVDLEGARAALPTATRKFTAEEADELFQSLRGICKGAWDNAGGSEAWLRNERENFYGEGKKDLR